MELSNVFFIISSINLSLITGSRNCLEEQGVDEEENWGHIFPSEYKPNAPPVINGEKTDLLLGIYPRGIPEIVIEKMFLKIDVYIVLIWNDCRLSLPSINQTTALPNLISRSVWHPKIFFGNGLGAAPTRFNGDISPMFVNEKHQLFYTDSLEEQGVDEEENWGHIFPSEYKPNAPPVINGEKTDLLLGIYPRGIPEIVIEKMFLKIDVYIVLIWNDCRLSLPSINQTTALPNLISRSVWHPKIFFGNGLGAAPTRFNGDISPMFVNEKHQLFYTDSSEEEDIDEVENWESIFPPQYKQNAPPKSNGEQKDLLLGIYPRGIPEIVIANMYLKIDVYIVLIWNDCRLSLPTINQTVILPNKISRRIWHPKLFFSNGLGAAPLGFNGDISPMFVSEKHQLFYSVRKIVPFYCEFDLSSYPMDIQRCELHIHPVDSLMVKEYTNPEEEISLIGRSPPHLSVRSVKRENCKEEVSRSMGRSCLALILIMERSVPYYLTVVYFPSMLIVSLTWLSFWLDVDASAPRVTLGLTSLLTLATQFATTQKDLPPVSYVKAIDVWMFVCLLLVFASLVEFAVANYIHRRKSSIKVKPAKQNILVMKTVTCNEPAHENVTQDMKSNSAKMLKISFIDEISRKVFPIGFLVFIIVYWSYYLFKRNSFNDRL